MIEGLLSNTRMRIPLIIFCVYSLWWVSLQFIFQGDSIVRDYFSDTYGITALMGGVIGLRISSKWGGWGSKMGRAIVLFSCGLLAQALGQFAYTFYFLVLNIEVPYPSIGDLGYFGSIPFYIYGTLLLGRASGLKVSLKSLHNQIFALVIPLVVLGFSYYKFLQGYEFDWYAPLVVLLDFGYPLGQAIYVSLAFLTYLLSRNTLGGVMRSRILLFLVALMIQYAADYTFLLQASQGTWSAGGLNDYLYLVSYFVMTIALFNLRMSDVRRKLEQA